MTAARSYLAGLSATCLLLTVVWASAFVYQIGAPVAAEYWIPEMRIVKLRTAARIPGEKVVILGGSNALFGLDSTLIERQTHRPTVNLSLHAALPLAYMFADARSLLRPRDVVILSLEYGYYTTTSPSPSWFSSNIMAWDPRYFWRLGLSDQVAFALSASAKRVLNGVIAKPYEARLRQTHGRRVRAPAEVLDEAAAVWRDKRYRNQPAVYSFRSMDEHGDIQNNVGSFYTEDPDSLVMPRFEYSPSVWDGLRHIRDECRRNDIRVFIAWPAVPTELGRHAAPARRYLAAVLAQVARLGIPTLGEPGDYALPRRYFYDTVYHLNEEGRAIRTTRLLSSLKSQL